MRAFTRAIESYLEELSFLPVQRRALLFSHEISLDRFREHEDRIEAQLDGLRHAGPDAVPAIEAGLGSEEPWVLYASVRAWLEVSSPAPEAVAARLDSAKAEELPSWIEALRSFARPIPVLAESTPARAALLSAAPWNGSVDLRVAEMAANDGSTIIRRSAARALGADIGLLGSPRALTLLEGLADDPDPGTRSVALWSLCLLQPTDAAVRLRQNLEFAPEPFPIFALGLFGGEEDLGPLSMLASSEKPRVKAAALRALGSLGFPQAVPVLLEALGAEEAISMAAADGWAYLTGEIVQEVEGPIPETAAEEEATDPPRRFDVEAARAKTPGGQHRLLRGRPRDTGDDMEQRWRRALVEPGPDGVWHRREVPSDLFTGAPSEDMRLGE